MGIDMNTEEDEFKRIEREALRLWAAQTDEDDDTQVYKKPWVGLDEDEIRELYGKDLNYRDGNYVRYAKSVEAKLKERNT